MIELISASPAGWHGGCSYSLTHSFHNVMNILNKTPYMHFNDPFHYTLKYLQAINYKGPLLTIKAQVILTYPHKSRRQKIDQNLSLVLRKCHYYFAQLGQKMHTKIHSPATMLSSVCLKTPLLLQ